MNSNELRKKFLLFFEKKGHTIIPSASLVPENDPTILFTTAGMHPLVPFLLGEKHPAGKKLANAQICIRTDDIDEVGDDVHHTFFEMLGNWSLGDYFKEEAIKMSFEFLTDKKWLGINKNKLAISIFEGDQDALRDDESEKIWLKLGIPKERIKGLSKEDNWWGPAGQTGPCGPDTEMFYWNTTEEPPKEFNPDDKRWVEIWNDVFMEYFKSKEGNYEPLSQKNVDTGMGLERILSCLNALGDDYKTDVFWPIIQEIEKLSQKKYEENIKEFRVIADHIKAATFIIGDNNGVEPSNIGQGYVVRRLIRRTIRYGKRLGMSKVFLKDLIEEVIKIYQETYPYIKEKKDYIIEVIKKEDEKFEQAINEGLKRAGMILNNKKPISSEIYSQMMHLPVKKRNEVLIKLYKSRKDGDKEPDVSSLFNLPIKNKEIFEATVSGKEAFDLYQSYGFPIEMIFDLAQEKNLFVDGKDFENEVKKHQELSRTASAGKFKGGLADAGEQATKYHTATHLLLAALKKVLGPDVSQKGSNITAERLRFDFSYPAKMTEAQIKEVEDIVNQKIKEDLQVVCEETSLEEAKKKGAEGVFENKYGEKVKVWTIEGFSKEICGGPHVKRTSELGKFRIKKEEASSSGVRRIRAVLE